MAAMWIFVVVLALGIGMIVWALVGRGDGGRPRQILAERFARGELTPEQYREHLALVGGGRDRGRGLLPIAVTLVVLGLIGSVASAGIAMGRGEMGWMMGGGNGMMGNGMMGNMMGGDTGRQGDAPVKDAPEREVKAIDFGFSPSTVRIPADKTVNITFLNAGASFHTFTVSSLDFELRAQGGDDISGSLRASKTGRYTAICTVPGHERMGMKATLIVEE